MSVDDTAHLKELVTAPAGSGKTVQLVRRYLHELRRGVPAESIVAITFTRKAAAELVERLSSVLGFQAGLLHEAPSEIDLYLSCAPDAEPARRALEALPNAPVSTVDSFVHRLVSEFLLDARYELPGQGSAWLDGPLGIGGVASTVFEEAARDALEVVGDDGELNPHSRALLAELRLSDAIENIAELAVLVDHRPTSNADLLGAVGATPLTRDADFAAAAAQSLNAHPGPLAELLAWGGDEEDTPPALLAALARAGRKAAAFKTERLDIPTLAAAALGAATTDGQIEPWDGWAASEGWLDRSDLDRADRLRVAAWALSRDARTRALRRLASEATADHRELIRAAATLCNDAKQAPAGSRLAALRTRFAVLMVDEVQDTNPDQLAFYKAFRAMADDLSLFFVGDTRQSIYRFRDGDPHGWEELIRDTPADRVGALGINYRSTELLVGFQKSLFGQLRAIGERGVDDTSAVQSFANRAGGLRTAEVEERPVLVVDAGKEYDVARMTIAAFAHRLGQSWQTLGEATAAAKLPPGAPATDTAAVLVTSWKAAAGAAAELARHGIVARVVGDRSLLQSRVATDLRLLLRALLDPTDEIAWMGLLKHPSIGLRDAALPRLRPFGRLLAPAGRAEDEIEGLSADDSARLAAVMPILTAARKQLGREPTGAVLEEVLSLLGWRPILGAGPEGPQGLAELELLLDVVRATESERVEPRDVVSALTPSKGSATGDLPKVRLEAAGPVVEITTIFSAKGLQYDHVCCPVLGRGGSDGVGGGKAVQVIRAGGETWLGVRLDPAGALAPRRDPLAALFASLGRAEARQEGQRLLYVAVTRAKHTLTLGLPPGDKPGKNFVSSIRKALGLDPIQKASAKKNIEEVRAETSPAVRVLQTGNEEDAPLLAVPPMRAPSRSRCAGATRPVCLWADSEAPAVRSPSSWADSQEKGARSSLVKAYRESVTVIEGGSAAPKLPWPGEKDPDPRDQGDVVHEWLERWAFRGAPEPEAARKYLVERWRCDDMPLAAALCELGTHLLDALPEFRALIDNAARLRFESPILARVGDDALVGRGDLLVDHDDGSVTVIDFKAGTHAASGPTPGPDDDEAADAKVKVPGLSGYAWQLEAYRQALTASGSKVREVGLLYVRGPSWARWTL